VTIMATAAPIRRADIEAKLREINGEVRTTASAAAPVGLAIGALALVAVVGLAYVFGRRRGRLKSTVVEIRRT
jgi:hypothetical protein